ncbi:hypothetical protein N9L68_06760 [bacterium]|nr:hypothetical protein [bacterium]
MSQESRVIIMRIRTKEEEEEEEVDNEPPIAMATQNESKNNDSANDKHS